VQTTIGRLRDSLAADDNNEKVYVGEVRYINYETDQMPEGNALWPFVHKRKSFEHEQELRVVVVHQNQDLQASSPPGVRVRVDLRQLLERIHVAPESPDWFREVVYTSLERFEVRRDVERSALDATPLF
jgi:hypothetical protein